MRAANNPAASSSKEYPKSLELQVGSQQTHPAELTQVSDSGKCAQLTTLRLQGRRVCKKNACPKRQASEIFRSTDNNVGASLNVMPGM
ncbi:hypothetical protein DXZ79_01015 [Yersinia rochesterensis]|uniref:Uncharacterized protein n=1 Tax=Yersinia rochesterensis TaxID=1604335 RepID=A0A8D4N0D7_9GAMM|nr:hypothetical protein DXZ79_01015 [Yersinia rochesterensis]